MPGMLCDAAAHAVSSVNLFVPKTSQFQSKTTNSISCWGDITGREKYQQRLQQGHLWELLEVCSSHSPGSGFPIFICSSRFC
jgi:hypothetical protein